MARRKRHKSKRAATIRKNALRGRVGENLFKLESGVFEYGAERIHYGGDFIMHPTSAMPKEKAKKRRNKKKRKKVKILAAEVTPVTDLEKEFREGQIVDTKTGNAVRSELQVRMGATVVKKAVFF